MSVINRLNMYEYKEEKMRAPLFKKFRGLKIKGFVKKANGDFQINPDDPRISMMKLNKSISREALNNNVPGEILVDGGWVVFNNQHVGEFFTNEDFDKLFTIVKGEQVTQIQFQRHWFTRYIIQQIKKRVLLNDKGVNENCYIVTCKDGSGWRFSVEEFNRLGVAINGFITIDSYGKVGYMGWDEYHEVKEAEDKRCVKTAANILTKKGFGELAFKMLNVLESVESEEISVIQEELDLQDAEVMADELRKSLEDSKEIRQERLDKIFPTEVVTCEHENPHKFVAPNKNRNGLNSPIDFTSIEIGNTNDRDIAPVEQGPVDYEFVEHIKNLGHLQK